MKTNTATGVYKAASLNCLLLMTMDRNIAILSYNKQYALYGGTFTAFCSF